MERDFKGVWIPKEIWLNEELTWMEKLFFVEIDSLDNNKGCIASNQYFAEFFQITPQRASQIINKLINKKYMKVKYEYNGKEIKKRVLNIFDRGIKYSKLGIKFSLKGYQEKFKDNNTTNNTINNMYTQALDLIYNAYKERYNQTLAITDKEGKQIKNIIKKASLINKSDPLSLISQKLEILKEKSKENNFWTITPGKLLSGWNELVAKHDNYPYKNYKDGKPIDE